MKKTTLSLASALVASVTLSGCMATQPTYYGSSAAGSPTMQTVSQAELMASPEFADEDIANRHAALLARYKEFRQAPDSYLNAADASSACDLNETGKWLVTHGKPEKDILAFTAHTRSQYGMRTATTFDSITVLEGSCQNGLPEGPFLAVGNYRSVTTSDSSEPVDNAVRVRMEGNARDGLMDGTFQYFSVLDTTTRFNGETTKTRTYIATDGIVENGQDRETHLTLTAMDQTPGITTMVNRHRVTAMGQQTETVSYQGSRRTFTMNQLNNVAHGWMTNHLMSAGYRQTCMIQGELADDSACAGMAVAKVEIKPMDSDLLEQLVRSDNLGQYMSPYTSDGVLAEWVNMGTSASIGSTAGSGVGAVAGSMIAEQALESVPFGGLIGGFLGSAVGEEVGREAGISAVGGWENIRATSDRSFDSLTDMARYLAQKYGNEPTYGDAIKVTMQVYPEFQNAMASAY
jgi:hypothetical protein